MMAEPEIRDVLRQRFASAPAMPDTVLREVLERIPEIPQRRLAIRSAPRWRSDILLRAGTFAMAGVVLALFGGLLLVGLSPRQPEDSSRHAAAVPATASSLPERTPSPSPRATANVAERVAGEGPVIAWEQVDLPFLPSEPWSWFGVDPYDGRYLMEASGPDGKSGYYESRDGITWTPLEPDFIEQQVLGGAQAQRFGDLVVVRQGDGLRFYGPDGKWLLACLPDRDPTKRCAGLVWNRGIEQAAISPAGFLVIAPVPPEQVIADILGPEVAQGEWHFLDDRIHQWDRKHPRSEHQVWFVQTGDGVVHRIDLPDHGYQGSGVEEHYAAFGWFSPDGVEWTPLHGPSDWFGGLTGTDDGFWSRTRDGLLHSADGIHWTRVGEGLEDLSPWPQGHGALASSRGRARDSVPPRLLMASTDGVSELPLSRQVRRAVEPDPKWEIQTGPLGLVALDEKHQIALYSGDGETWGIAPLPAAWSLAKPYNRMDSFLVGDREVLVVRYHCSSSELTPEKCGAYGAFSGTEPEIVTLWRGAVAEPVEDA